MTSVWGLGTRRTLSELGSWFDTLESILVVWALPESQQEGLSGVVLASWLMRSVPWNKYVSKRWVIARTRRLASIHSIKNRLGFHSGLLTEERMVSEILVA